MTNTLLISNGQIVDGSGQEPFRGHVLVRGEEIAAVARAGSEEAAALLDGGARSSLDATGLAVSPGFIDAHSHFDWQVSLPEHADLLCPLVEQGITTVVAGNCGFSPAPIRAGDAPRLNAFAEFFLEGPLACRWQGMGEFLQTLDRGGLLFNHVQLTGHGTLHLSAVGDLRRTPAAAEMAGMLDTLRESLAQGSYGLSLGLQYAPGMFYGNRDLACLAGVTAESGRVLTVHVRALSRYSGAYPNIPFLSRPHNLRALEEILAVGLATGVKLQLSHLIFVGRRSWPTAPRALEMIERAAARGLRVRWDVYPHFCGNSYLSVFLPTWFMADCERNLRNPRARRRVKFELRLARRLLGFSLADIQIMEAGCPDGERFNGLNLVEIGRLLGQDPADALLQLVRDSGGRALQLAYGYSGDERHEGLLASLIAHPRTLFMTDTIIKSRGFANPASYGAFPRILGRFVREKQALSLAEAVAKMSGRTARWFGIPRRGEIRPGYHADLALWDPDRIADTSTRTKPASRPHGMEYVFINGEKVVEQGKYLRGRKPGRALAFEAGRG